MKKLALFDFDGTITRKDTLLEFALYYSGKYKFYLKFLLLSPFLLLLKTGILSSQKAKEYFFRLFFKGEEASLLKQKGMEFSRDVLPSLIRENASEKMRELKTDGYDIYIVTASSDFWIQYWADQNQLRVISTTLEIKEGKVTGRIVGKNCKGPEKVARIKKEIELKSYHHIISFGDSSGDREMLELANEAFYRAFH